jgi:hypothetical protein
VDALRAAVAYCPWPIAVRNGLQVRGCPGSAVLWGSEMAESGRLGPGDADPALPTFRLVTTPLQRQALDRLDVSHRLGIA